MDEWAPGQTGSQAPRQLSTTANGHQDKQAPRQLGIRANGQPRTNVHFQDNFSKFKDNAKIKILSQWEPLNTTPKFFERAAH